MDNLAFESLDEASQQAAMLIDMHSPNALTNTPDHRIKAIPLSCGHAVIVQNLPSPTNNAIDMLRSFTQELEQQADPFIAAAQSIQKILQWRWVAITRFVTPKRLEVLAFYDGFSKLETSVYDVAGTPCQMVVEKETFVSYCDLQRAFPNYQALMEMGAKTYAGLIYRDHHQRPIGHIMAMHDNQSVDFIAAQDVIKISTVALAAQLQLKDTSERLTEANFMASTDGLTGVGNRQAFDSTLAQIKRNYTGGDDVQVTLAIIDLDRLKVLNDVMGHGAGDKFIVHAARELSTLVRQQDQVFRIGGDEFALLFTHHEVSIQASVERRFCQSIARIRKALNFDVDASLGFATIGEVNGDLDAWIELADQRMYTLKRMHHQRAGNANLSVPLMRHIL